MLEQRVFHNYTT